MFLHSKVIILIIIINKIWNVKESPQMAVRKTWLNWNGILNEWMKNILAANDRDER